MRYLIKNFAIHSPHQIFEMITRRTKRFLTKIGLGAYYCKALSGESDYNICINSDMSVSCNCRDYDASGQIGNLTIKNLQEIFDGEIAQSLRHRLSYGQLPIPACHNCIELTFTSKKNARAKCQTYTVPNRGIMVENTVICRLKCLACDRSIVQTRKVINGKPGGGKIMNLDDIQTVAQTVKDYKIKQVCFHNQGEPFLSKRILDEMKIMRRLNPKTKIIVSTNGLLIDTESKREASLLFDHIFISLDGSTQQSVEQYQRGNNFEKVYQNIKNLVAFRDSRSLQKPIIEWKYVVFEWNDSNEEIELAVKLAQEAKIDRISFWRGYLPAGQGVSIRFNKDSFFANLGEPSWKGREIIFNK